MNLSIYDPIYVREFMVCSMRDLYFIICISSCLAALYHVNRTCFFFSAVRTIKQTTAEVILAFIHDTNLIMLTEEFIHQNVTGKTWFASESWINVNTLNVQRFGHIFDGTIGFGLYRGFVSGFRDFLVNVKPTVNENVTSENLVFLNNADYFFQEDSFNQFFIKFWEDTFSCSFFAQKEKGRLCTGKEDLDQVSTPLTEVSQLQYAYNLYIAVYVVAHAIQDEKTCKSGFGPFENGSCATTSSFQHWQVQYLSNFLVIK